MGKHTPGPWEAGEWVSSSGKGVYLSIFAKKRRVSSVGVYGKLRDGTTAGRKYKDKFGTERVCRTAVEPECEANARLIASAPDLLKAAKDAVHLMRLLPGEIECEDEYNALQAAIEKATI